MSEYVPSSRPAQTRSEGKNDLIRSVGTGGPVQPLLAASSRLVDRIAAVAQPYAEFREAIRTGHVPDGGLGPRFGGDVLMPVLELGGVGDTETLIARVEGKDWARPEVIEGLLRLSDIVGFENPYAGRDLAGAALVAASKLAAEEDLIARALMALASWNRVLSGQASELFVSVMARGGLDEALKQELSRRYAYVLADVGENLGAHFSAWTAWSAKPVPGGSGSHETGRNALALAYTCARSGETREALRWHLAGLEQLDPAAGFPECWQAAINTVHLMADLEETVDVADVEAYAAQLAACSPYSAGSIPDLSLKWGLGRNLFQEGVSAQARPLLTEVCAGFEAARLLEDWSAVAADLAFLEFEQENFAAAEQIIERIPDHRELLLVVQHLIRTRKPVPEKLSTLRRATGFSWCSLVV